MFDGSATVAGKDYVGEMGEVEMTSRTIFHSLITAALAIPVILFMPYGGIWFFPYLIFIGSTLFCNNYWLEK